MNGEAAAKGTSKSLIIPPLRNTPGNADRHRRSGSEIMNTEDTRNSKSGTSRRNGFHSDIPLGHSNGQSSVGLNERPKIKQIRVRKRRETSIRPTLEALALSPRGSRRGSKYQKGDSKKKKSCKQNKEDSDRKTGSNITRSNGNGINGRVEMKERKICNLQIISSSVSLPRGGANGSGSSSSSAASSSQNGSRWPFHKGNDYSKGPDSDDELEIAKENAKEKAEKDKKRKKGKGKEKEANNLKNNNIVGLDNFVVDSNSDSLANALLSPRHSNDERAQRRLLLQQRRQRQLMEKNGFNLESEQLRNENETRKEKEKEKENEKENLKAKKKRKEKRKRDRKRQR